VKVFHPKPTLSEREGASPNYTEKVLSKVKIKKMWGIVGECGGKLLLLHPTRV
jgi:hypothetical protein